MKSSKASPAKWAKLVWIELIGFDNTKPDFGVEDFLSRMEVKPSRVALLLCNTEIIHAHKNLKKDFRIGAQHCSYAARPYNEERKRQDDWTAFKLRGLNRTLQKHGIEVYAAVFDYVMIKDMNPSLPDHDKWNQKHQELFCTLSNGNVARSICHFKHLSDGTLYEDFFSRQLASFLSDYCFDGWLACDGYAHPRYPIFMADFSDDVVSQFEQFIGKKIQGKDIPERSKAILGSNRLEWMNFCVKRQKEFFTKTADAVHHAHKKIIAFNAWTRDPFEAFWRYGTDYRDIANAGVDELVAECCAGVVTLEGWNHGEDTEMLDRNHAMLLRLAAYLPQMKIYQLHAVKDDCEEYCVLRHAPTMAATEIQSNGALQHAGKSVLAGAMACLGDALKPSEWQFLDKSWKTIFDLECGTPISPMLLWSDQAMQAELEAYGENRICSSFRMLAELLCNGMQIARSGSIDEALSSPETPVLVLHPLYYSKAGLDKLTKRCHQVFMVGRLSKSDFGARVIIDGKVHKEFFAKLSEVKAPEEPFLYWKSLPESLPPRSFWKKTAKEFNSLYAQFTAAKNYKNLVYSFDNSKLRIVSFQNGLLFATNTSKDYMPARINSKCKIDSVESLTFYPAIPVGISQTENESVLNFKIPPLGTAILKCHFS